MNEIKMNEIKMLIPFGIGALNTEGSKRKIPFKLIKMGTCFYYGDCKFRKEDSSNTTFKLEIGKLLSCNCCSSDIEEGEEVHFCEDTLVEIE